MSITYITTEEQFKDVIENSKAPVLVDFWATWCAPCKMIAPILDQISDERNDVMIAKVDVDQLPEISKTYGIRSIPTLMLFSEAQVEATKIGALNKSQINAFIDSNI
jgi:thioredoxin 1